MEKLKEVVILGGGYAGVTAGKILQKKLKKNPMVRVRLISRSKNHILLTQLHEVAGKRTRPKDVSISLKEIFKDTKIDVVEDNITSINPEKQVLIGENMEYDFDYLILGTGSQPEFYDIPGLEQHSFTLWSLNDAEAIKSHVRSMFIGAQQETDPQKRQAMLTFVVGGGGFTGIEMIGELAEWVQELCQKYNVSRDDVRMIVVEALDKILPCLNKDGLIERAREYLTEDLGIEIMTDACICKVEKDSIDIGDKIISSETLIWTGGVKANKLVKNSGFKLNERDRIDVNKYCQTNYDNIYAVGDNSYFKTSENRALPALVEAAMQTAKTAANNIVSDIEGGKKKFLKPKLHGIMVSIGGNYAVADIMGIPLWGFIAMMMKHMVDIHYLWEINGFKQVEKYIIHEFSDIKGGIGIMVRHMTRKMSAFWLVLLRVFLGFRFLIEGINKIQDGYFGEWERLASGASNILWTETTPEWYIWIMKTFVVPNQLLIQKFIVVAEIGLGLLLIMGLFTVLAALGTAGMSISFIMAAWGATGVWDPIMILMGSIALLGGGGKAFSLDYYIMPWLFSLSKKPTPYPKHITFKD